MATRTREIYDNNGHVILTETIPYDDADIIKSQAQIALTASDMTAIRCMKAGVSFPFEWKTYVAELRIIVNSGTGEIPAKPPYPEGA